MRSSRGALGLALLLAATPLVAAPQSQVPPGTVQTDPVLARVFEVRFRSLDDAAQLVTKSNVLSPQGIVSLQPGLRMLVVQDRASVLDRVASLLKSFDLPPRNVEITLSLFLGSDRREEQAGRQSQPGALSKEVRGVIETLGDFTKWTDYSLLGGHSLTSIEGSRVELRLSDDYKALFEVAAVKDTPAGTVVSLKRFTLQRIVRTADGSERAEDYLLMDVDLPAGKNFVLGAAKSPESRKVLFIAFQAKAR